MSKLEITPGCVLFLCAYFYLDPAHTFVPFLLAVILHEGGHLAALKLLRVPVVKIRLGALGAQICTGEMPYLREAAAAAAGPAVNLILFLLFMRRSSAHALVNLFLLLFNLLPVFPLDGGRILRALLRLLLPVCAAETVEKVIRWVSTAALGAGACWLTGALHSGLWPILTYGFLLLRMGPGLEQRKFRKEKAR